MRNDDEGAWMPSPRVRWTAWAKGRQAPSTLGETKMLIELRRLLLDEEGATAIEYGLMAAAIAGVLIVAAYFLGGKVSEQINNVAQHIG